MFDDQKIFSMKNSSIYHFWDVWRINSISFCFQAKNEDFLSVHWCINTDAKLKWYKNRKAKFIQFSESVLQSIDGVEKRLIDDIYRYDLTDCEGAWDSEAWTDDADDEDGAGLWRVFCEESLEMTCDTLRRPGHQTLDRDHARSSDQHCQHGSDGSRWLQLQQEKVAVNYRNILIKYLISLLCLLLSILLL